MLVKVHDFVPPVVSVEDLVPQLVQEVVEVEEFFLKW